MDRKLKLLGFPLQIQQAVASDGLRRALVVFPNGSKILHLGVVPPQDTLCLFALCPQPAEGETPWPSMGKIEFVIAGPGDNVPDSYIMRAPVKLQAGVVFLFEKPVSGPKLFVPPGAIG